jgi:hypothetical protein
MVRRTYPGSVGLVEDALGLVAGRTLRSCLDQERSQGILTWRAARSGEVIATVGYHLIEVADGMIMNLAFSVGGEAIDQSIRILPTHPHFGGVRHWFACPACGGRSSNLHLPPSCPLFLCRRCHGLSYNSARSSRCWDATARRLGCERREVNRLFRRAERQRIQATRPVGPVVSVVPTVVIDAKPIMERSSRPENA